MPATSIAAKPSAAENPVPASALSFTDVPSLVDEEFLTKVADILERLRSQSELRGHPLLASLLAITKDEAEDDLRTRIRELQNGGLLSDADDGVIKMAQRLACAPRDGDDDDGADESKETAQLLPFLRV
jgi:hypothetical protein